MVSSKTIGNLRCSLQNHWNLQLLQEQMLGDIFSLVLCGFHTVKWCKESIYMVHIKWTLWILIYVVCKKFVFCRKLILKALFRFNGTSKPSLTIALKILKTIEKPLIPMVGPSKNIQWWWSNVVKTIEKPLKSMVAWKKTLTIPSLWKIDHRHGLYHFLSLLSCSRMSSKTSVQFTFAG